MKPRTPWDGAPGRGRLERAARQTVALGEAGVGPPRAAVGDLDRPEELLLEPVGALLVELLVGVAERRERGAEEIGRLRDAVEQTLPRLLARIGHGLSVLSSATAWSGPGSASISSCSRAAASRYAGSVSTAVTAS